MKALFILKGIDSSFLHTGWKSSWYHFEQEAFKCYNFYAVPLNVEVLEYNCVCIPQQGIAGCTCCLFAISKPLPEEILPLPHHNSTLLNNSTFIMLNNDLYSMMIDILRIMWKYNMNKQGSNTASHWVLNHCLYWISILQSVPLLHAMNVCVCENCIALWH